MTATRNSPKQSTLSYDKYCANFTKIYFSARWLVRSVIQNRDTHVPTEVESGFGIFQVKSGQSRLIRDTWTLCKGFWGVRGHASREKTTYQRHDVVWEVWGKK